MYVNAPDVELYVRSPLPLAAGLGLITEISVRAIPLPPLDVKSGPATHLLAVLSHFKTCPSVYMNGLFESNYVADYHIIHGYHLVTTNFLISCMLVLYL